MRQLRCYLDSVMATRRNGPLPLQRMWAISQDERSEPTADQAQTAPGKETIISRIPRWHLLLFPLIQICLSWG